MAARRSRSIVLALVAVVAIGAGVWAYRRSTEPVPIQFRTTRIDRGPVEQAVTATGALNAVVTVQVGSQVSGVISKLGADFNSQVKEGEVIAQIDPTRFRANLEQAKATLKSAQASVLKAGVAIRQAKVDLERTRALVDKKVLGVAELDAARTKADQAAADEADALAKVGQAKAQVGIAQVDLERTTIRAPISGTVLQRAVDVGQTVAASLQAPVLFTIAQDLSRMEVHAAIDEADVGKVKEGQDATFTVDAYPNDVFHATIFQIRSQPNVVQNVVTYDAILRFDNPDGKLRPGMTATVRVVSDHKDDVLRVPNAALRFKPAPELVAGGAGRGDKGGGGRKGEEGPSGERAGSGPGRAHDAVPTANVGRAPAGTAPEGPSGPGAGKGAKGDQVALPRARVYRPAGDHVTPVPFRPGIGDDEYTEIVSGPLHEGDEVVTDVASGPQRANATSGGQRRGPRFF